MPAYKCHACPYAWAREHSVHAALKFRPPPGRADSSCRAARKAASSAQLSLFHSLFPRPPIAPISCAAVTQCGELGLQDAEKCVAWGVKARTASSPGSVRTVSRHGPEFRRHNRVPGVTVSGRWTSPLLWRRRHVDLIRRSRGPTVTRAIALQDYS